MPGRFLQGLFNGIVEELILDLFLEYSVFASTSQGAGKFPCSRNKTWLKRFNRPVYIPQKSKEKHTHYM